VKKKGGEGVFWSNSSGKKGGEGEKVGYLGERGNLTITTKGRNV